MNSNLINKLVYLYYFFSIFVIFTIRYESFYLSSVIGGILIFLILFYKKNINIIRNRKQTIIFKFICYTYCIYTLSITIFINKELLIYSINKIIPLLLLCQLIDYYNLDCIDLEKLKKYCINLFLCGIFLIIFLYFIGIDYIQIGDGIKTVSKSYDFMRFGEYRPTGFLSHKSRAGIYCIIAAMMALGYNGISIIKKIIIIFSIVLASFLNNSLTTFSILIFVIIIYIIFTNLKLIKNKINIVHVILMFLSIMTVALIIIYFLNNINNIYTLRDFSNMGKREYIWKYAVDYINLNKYGVIKIPGDLALNGYSFMTNAHNMFLNEFIETGIVGGILYLCLSISFIFVLEDSYSKICYMSILFASQFDKMISNEITYILWGVLAIYTIRTKKKYRR